MTESISAQHADGHPADQVTGLARLIAIDVRSLAALRIGLAVILLADLFQRLDSLALFCTDQGVLTRKLNFEICPPEGGFWSLYWINGSLGFAGGLIAVNALAAICLLLGWKTRTATAVCLVLAYSLQIRNPLILTAGHILIRMLLFWSLFLPLGAIWSLDSWRRKNPLVGRTEVVSVASAAIMIQITAMYLFSGIAKWNDVWLSCDAMSLALQLDMYVRPLGRVLLDYPALLMMLTFCTLLLESVGPLLLWMPLANLQWRAAMAALFCSMHVGIWLTMSVGIFSAVAMLAWVVFIPRGAWQWMTRRGPAGSNAKQKSADRHPGRLSLVPSLICAFFLAYVLLLNIANVDPIRSGSWFGGRCRSFGYATMTMQQFKMFERPAADNLWWRLVITSPDGKILDVFPPDPRAIASLSQRPDPDETYDSIPNQFWKRLLFNLATIELPPDVDPSLLVRLRQRTGEVIWHMRDTKDQLPPKSSVEWLCCRRAIDSDEWDPPVRVESWGVFEASPDQMAFIRH